MKKILKFIITICILFLNTLSVQALSNDTTLTTSYIDNVWSFHYRNGKVFTYGQLPFRYVNGKMAYCIDPPTPINTSVYSSYTDFSISGYSDDVKRQMELISHYGYGYPGHEDIKYYMATQELIWLFSDDEYIKWTVGSTSDTPEIDISKEKQEILNLVNNHNILPSFINRSYNSLYGETTSYIDNNNVLNNYEITSEIHDFSVNNNNLKVISKKFGTHTLNFKSKGSSGGTTTVYKSDSIRSQMVAVFGFNDIKSGTISIGTFLANVTIRKKDINTNEVIQSDKVKFNIKNLDTNTYEKKNINTYLSGPVYFHLPKGNYLLEETSASYGYVINKEKVKFTIDDNLKLEGNSYILDFYNDTAKGKINVTKKDEKGNHLIGVEIGLFDKDYNLIKSKITTDDEIISFENLELGKYYIKEISANEGYILDNEYHEVNLEYKDDKTYVVEENIDLINEKIKCDVTFIVVNEEDEPLKNVKINIYNDDNEVIYSGNTNEDGKIVIENLEYGKYYIKEESVPSGYILNDEKIEFSVNDLECLSNIKIVNEKTIMPVTSSAKLNIGFSGLIMLGIIYVFKKII